MKTSTAGAPHAEDPTTTGFSEVILQAYNFGGDPSITGANAANDTAYRSNAVPEPGSFTMLSAGLLGLVFAARAAPALPLPVSLPSVTMTLAGGP